MNLTCVILTKNEEENISECIKSVYFCDEVIIIDDYSTDKTTEIARKLGARVYKRSLNDDFASQRNFGLAKATSKWALFLDADERIAVALRDEIIQMVSNPLITYEGFFLKRKDVVWGKEINQGEVGRVKLLRLAKKSSGKWRRRVHEIWQIKGKTKALVNPILHYPHSNLREFIKDINYFSTLHSSANRQERKNASLAKIVIWPLGKFVYNWIFKLGFRDKTAGFVTAGVMSFHSFLAWSKLWFLQRKDFTSV